MTTIFISYRRSDDPYAARSINDALCAKFGKENVYFDLDSMRPGLDWRKQIDSMVAECDVMLVVIGDRWLQLDETDRSRLEDEEDLVRLEVASALKREIPVIPVLVGKATIPARDSLPEELVSLVYRQAVEVRASSNFGSQIRRLLTSIKAVTTSPSLLSRLNIKIAAVALVLALMTIGVALLWEGGISRLIQKMVGAGGSVTLQDTNETHEQPTPIRVPPANSPLPESSGDFETLLADAGSKRDAALVNRNSVAFTSELKSEYEDLFTSAKIDIARRQQVDAIVDKILQFKDRYLEVQNALDIPWYFVAVIHNSEGSLRFDRHLHNGDPLTERTKHVPAGRPVDGSPPFRWEESAIDAFRLRRLDKIDWTIERLLYEIEGYNGWGYRKFHSHVKSPYLWSFTNHYTSGGYTSDGTWSDTKVSRQAGAAAVLIGIIERGVGN